MLFTAQMRYIRMIVLEKDFKKLIDLLADFGWLEIKSEKQQEEKKEKFEEMNRSLDSIESMIIQITDFLDIKKSRQKGELLDISYIEQYLKSLLENISAKREELASLLDKKKELENGLKELSDYKDLKITKKELQELNYLHFAVGSLSQKDLELLESGMKGRLYKYELAKDLYLLFTSKKGKWTLESELKKVHFKERPLPFEEDALPSELFAKISAELKSVDESISRIEAVKKDVLKKEAKELKKLTESFNLQKIYQEIYRTIKHSGAASIIEGWILKKDLNAVKTKSKELLGDRVSIVSYDPDELDEVKTGKLKVPVLMDNLPFVKPFENLVFNYGAPLYGTVDPTIFVAFSFLMLFGLMFGDIGQGLVIMLAGFVLRKIKRFKDMRDTAMIMIYAGISAMFFGYLYGSIFCFEHHELQNFFTPINRTLFGIDKPYIINITINDINSIMNLFALTVGFGVFINLLGISLNIVNNILKKKIGEALFSRTGAAGFALLFCLAVVVYTFFIAQKSVPGYFFIIIMISLILIFFKEPLSNILSGSKKLFDHGPGMWLLHSIVELIEVALSIMSNNLSFIRVGAFAFAHALLSLTALRLAAAAGGSYASAAGIAVLAVGNLVIIMLEGMIVSIQTIRLEYYEFFSKFFNEIGKKFIPFKIEKNKLEDIQ